MFNYHMIITCPKHKDIAKGSALHVFSSKNGMIECGRQSGSKRLQLTHKSHFWNCCQSRKYFFVRVTSLQLTLGGSSTHNEMRYNDLSSDHAISESTTAAHALVDIRLCHLVPFTLPDRTGPH